MQCFTLRNIRTYNMHPYIVVVQWYNDPAGMKTLEEAR